MNQAVFTYDLLRAAIKARGRVTSNAAIEQQQIQRERVLELEWLSLEFDRMAKGCGLAFYPRPRLSYATVSDHE